MNEGEETVQVRQTEHQVQDFSALASAVGSEESGGRKTSQDDGEPQGYGLTKLIVSPEELQAAIEKEIDKLFLDLAAHSKACFHRAIVKPVSRREKRVARLARQ